MLDKNDFDSAYAYGYTYREAVENFIEYTLNRGWQVDRIISGKRVN